MNPTLLAGLLVISSCMACSVRPVTGENAGDVVLESGIRARWRYQFDRNSLQDARLSGKSVIALTDSGDLLCFDADTLTLKRERAASRDYVCLGSGPGGAVLAGADDGTVSTVNPESLEPTVVARVQYEIEWVGSDPDTGGVLVVTRPTHDEEAADVKKRNDPVKCRVHDLISGRVHELRQQIRMRHGTAAVFVDSCRRVWIGYDAGEWGGGTIFVDLTTGAAGEVKDDSAADNVFGFFEPAPGEVWAHGGLIHFSASWFIARVDRGKAEMVFHSRDDDGNRNELPPGTPRLPITGILPDRPDGALLVLSYHELYRLHRNPNRWEKLHEFRPRYIHGRPDAMGSYPAIVRVLQRESDPLKLILATRLDGFLRLSHGVVSSHAIPELAVETHPKRRPTAKNGVRLDHEELPAFLADWWPDRKVDPLPLPGVDDKEWREHFVMEEKDGSLLVFSEDGTSPGRRQVARWKAGRLEKLHAGSGNLSVLYCFTTPDGTLWCADNGGLYRFDHRDWVRCNHENRSIYGGYVVSSGGPPWVLFSDSNGHQLYRIHVGEQTTDARVEQAAAGEKDRVRDILELEPGRFLLATDGGLKTWKPGDPTFSPPMVDPPTRKVWRLARDRSGRIWMGGRGLWLLQSGHLIALDEVPHVSSWHVWSLKADPDDPLGVIVSPGDNPSLFVSVDDMRR